MLSTPRFHFQQRSMVRVLQKMLSLSRVTFLSQHYRPVSRQIHRLLVFAFIYFSPQAVELWLSNFLTVLVEDQIATGIRQIQFVLVVRRCRFNNCLPTPLLEFSSPTSRLRRGLWPVRIVLSFYINRAAELATTCTSRLHFP